MTSATQASATQASATQTTQAVLAVPDITCDHCERVITKALTPVEGVQRVAVDIPARQVRVDYDPARVDVDRMTAILAEEEYPVAGIAPANSQAEATEPSVPVAGCSCCSPSR